MVIIDKLFYRFVAEHCDEDPVRLLLKRPVEHIDMRQAADQIALRRRLRRKLPSWICCEWVWIPSALASEQCSSEQTALFKATLPQCRTFGVDLTGGMGVDSWAFARVFDRWTLVESNEDYCHAVRHNYSALGVTNVQVECADASVYIDELDSSAFIYIDPARRGESNERLFDLNDYQPNVVGLLPQFQRLGAEYMIKVSPMADISDLVRQLHDVVEVVIVSVKNECKELLLRGGGSMIAEGGVRVRCVNILTDGLVDEFCFASADERTAQVDYASSVGAYLYEPNASVMKSGGVRTVSARFGISKLHINTHLYTSNELVESFCGRSFCVEEVVPFVSKELKTRVGKLLQANVACRNFPLSVEELRSKLKIKEGGDVYLFGATLRDNSRVLIRCRKI